MIDRRLTPATVALTAMLSFAAALPLAAQRDDATFEDSTSVVVVEVPVNVVKDGQPVRGLTAANFEVFDGRQQQPLTGFEVIDLGTLEGAPAAQQPIPKAAKRHFLFLFDLSFSDPQSVLQAREAALDLARNGLHPEDLAAVALYTLSGGPRMLLSFTPDREQLELAIETLGAPQLVSRAPDPLGITFGETTPGYRTGGHSLGSAEASTASLMQRTIRDHLREVADTARATDRRAAQTQVENLTLQLSELAKVLGSVDGRKHVLYLSEGFDNRLLTGEGTDERTANNMLSGELYYVDSDRLYGSGDVQNALEAMLQEFRRANCVIQSIDIGGARVANRIGGSAGTDDGLFAMANDTGGEFYNNFNSLSQAMDQMLDKTSVTYLLAFQPEDLKLDGAYHRLKIKLKDAPRGARVQHRPGYYAPLPYSEQNREERRLLTAEQLLGQAGGSIPMSVLATPFAVTGEKPYVPLLVEVDGPGLLAGSGGKALPVEIFVYALEQSGAVHDFFTQMLPLNLQQAEPLLAENGFKFYGHLDLDPGRYTVRVLVRNGQSGQSALEIVDLHVPDFQAGEPVVLPPLFPEPPGRWVMLREEAQRQRDVPFPFMLDDQPYLPAAAPLLETSGEARISLVAYHLGAGDLEVSGRLLAADGGDSGPASLALERRVPTGSPGEEVLVLRLEESPAPPGLYTLELRIRDPQTGTVAQTTAAIEIARQGGNLMRISRR